MGCCFGDHLLKVSEEESCLPGAPRPTKHGDGMRVPPKHPALFNGSWDVPAQPPHPADPPSYESLHSLDIQPLHTIADPILRRLVRGEPCLLHCRGRTDSDDECTSFSSGWKRPRDDPSLAEENLPAKRIRLCHAGKSILKKTKSRRRFSTPRRTFFVDDATILEYAPSRPPCEISYLMRVQSELSLCFDDGFWFRKTVYSSDESP